MIGKLVTKAVRKALKDAETLGAEVLVRANGGVTKLGHVAVRNRRR
jgi:hypothetical protein